MRNKKGNVFVWIIVFVISSLIVSAIIDPSIVGRIGENFGIGQREKFEVESDTEDPLIAKCEESYNLCRDITIKKYDISVWLNEVKKFNETSEANIFYNTWSDDSYGRTLGYDLTGMAWSSQQNFEDYPIVLIAVGRKGIAGNAPVVLICDKEGNLMSKSKDYMGC